MIGKTLGHYEILAPLGEGGMGQVYRARDTTLDRDVAIKVLPEDFASDANRLARFEREAKLLASLNHPNIATIHGFDESDGVRFIAMELVEGDSLAERIMTSGRIEVDEALEIARQIALALEAAHEAGVIHRDLKPANVQMTRRGTVKVLDFGIAKVHEPDGSSDLGESPTAIESTGINVIMGTAPYMSPEQARGKPVDKRADIWSFGCVLYEMLTGTAAFGGETVSDVVAAIIEREPDWSSVPDGAPWRVVDLLRQCLQKNPDRRVHDIADARISIVNAIADSDAGIAPWAGHGEAADPSWQRHIPTPIGVGLGVAMAAVTALVVWTLTYQGRQSPAPSMRLDVNITEGSFRMSSASSVVVSPDGTRLAYVTRGAEDTELHVQSLLQTDDRILATGAIYNPFFSPDGQWVGFTDNGERELRKVPVGGGSPVTIASLGRRGGRCSASWSTDDWIFYTPGLHSALFRVPAAGGDPERLTTLDAARGELTHRFPHALPGSNAVLFTSHTALTGLENGNIEVLDLQTGQRKVLLRGGFDARYVPTGHLVYARQGALHAVPFDLGRLEVQGAGTLIVPSLRTIDAPRRSGPPFSFAQTGALFYLGEESAARQYPVVWVDRQGNATPLWDEPGLYGDPTLSPDGTRLAIRLMRDDNVDVWIYDMERDVPSRLTFAEAMDVVPVWSPDGQFLVFGSDRSGPLNTYRIRADGSGQAEVLIESERNNWPMSWSDDGRFLAYGTPSEADLGADVWVLPVNGDREPHALLNTSAAEQRADLSPNGRWIAYESDESGEVWEVYVRPFPEGPGKWQLSSTGGGQPKWSADGREVFYLSETGVMAVAVDTEGDSFSHGRAEQLFEGTAIGGFLGAPLGDAYLRSYDVAADGQRFVMLPNQSKTRSGNVTLVTNWFDELKRLVPTDP